MTNLPGKGGKVFGRRLTKLTKTLVTVGAEHRTSLSVSKLVASACKYIEDNVETEGIYRKSGSQHRQKVMDRHWPDRNIPVSGY